MLFYFINHFRLDKCLRRSCDITEFLTDFNIVLHTAAKDTDLTVEFYSSFYCLLQTVNIRRKSGENNTACTFAEYIFNIFTDFFFTDCKLRERSIGMMGKER